MAHPTNQLSISRSFSRELEQFDNSDWEGLPSIARSLSDSEESQSVESVEREETVNHAEFKANQIKAIEARVKAGIYQGEEKKQIKKMLETLKKVSPSPVLTKAFSQVKELSNRLVEFEKQDRTFERIFLRLLNDPQEKVENRLICLTERTRFAAIRHIIHEEFQEIASKRLVQKFTQMFTQSEKQKEKEHPHLADFREAVLSENERQIAKLIDPISKILIGRTAEYDALKKTLRSAALAPKDRRELEKQVRSLKEDPYADWIGRAIALTLEKENADLFQTIAAKFPGTTFDLLENSVFPEALEFNQPKKFRYALQQLFKTDILTMVKELPLIGKLARDAAKHTEHSELVDFILSHVTHIYMDDLTLLVERLAENNDMENMKIALSLDSRRRVDCGDALEIAAKKEHFPIFALITAHYGEKIEKPEVMNAFRMAVENDSLPIFKHMIKHYEKWIDDKAIKKAFLVAAENDSHSIFTYIRERFGNVLDKGLITEAFLAAAKNNSSQIFALMQKHFIRLIEKKDVKTALTAICTNGHRECWNASFELLGLLDPDEILAARKLATKHGHGDMVSGKDENHPAKGKAEQNENEPRQKKDEQERKAQSNESEAALDLSLPRSRDIVIIDQREPVSFQNRVIDKL